MYDHNEALIEMISNTLKAIRATHDEKHEQLVKQRKEDAEKQREYIINRIRTALEEAHAAVTGELGENNLIEIVIQDSDLEALSSENVVMPDTNALLQLLECDFDDTSSTIYLCW